MSTPDFDPSVDPAYTPAYTGAPADSQPAPTTNGGAAGLKDSAINNASNAYNSVKNAQFTQDLANGPVATSVKNEAAATSNEFGDLASARTTPSYTAANDTPLTHYHSFFYSLLSWKNPRATGATFVAVLLFIFAGRYLPILRYSLKLSWMTLGVVTLAETASKLVAGGSVTSSVRPRRYYKIPKETLETFLDDIEQLINFFVIESQRIVFAENLLATAGIFAATFLSYYLVKLLPLWGMALLATSVTFLAPLIYVSNQEFIDSNLEQAGKVVNQQATQVRDLAGQHASKSFETVKTYTGEYAGVASDLVGKGRQKIPQLQNSVNKEDFPEAPKSDLPSQPITTEQTAPEPVPAI